MHKFGRKTICLILSAIIATVVIAGALVYLGKEEGRIERSFGSSFEAHQYLWGQTIKEAQTDKCSEYAIYASRILAVDHPEVYLQGDAIFLKQIMTTSGCRAVYLDENIIDAHFEDALFGGPPFSFKDVEFGSYEIVSSSQLYPENYPLFVYLDRRLFPIATTLKTWGNEITQLEQGEQFYFSLEENRGSAAGLYVIYCDNEETYLYDNGELTWMENLTKTGVIRGNPILIFNEENVWYPLMDRNDTAKDPILGHVVEEYSTAVQTPQLTESEENAIATLKQATELDGENQFLMAAMAAVHTEGTGRGIEEYPEFEAAWGELGIPSYATGVFQEIYKRADYLSPITAYLAWISGGHDGKDKIQAITGEYLKYAGAPAYNYKSAWGHIWSCMLVGSTIDESYRTRAGHCVWQAANISSVLDALNIKNYTIQILSQNLNHTILYLPPQYDLIVSNGAVVSKSIENRYPYVGIGFISSDGKWAHPRLYTYAGTLSPEESINALNSLKAGIDGGIEFRGIVGAYDFVSWSELISGLENEEWTPFELP